MLTLKHFVSFVFFGRKRRIIYDFHFLFSRVGEFLAAVAHRC